MEVDSTKRVKDLRQAIKEERDDVLSDVKAVNIMLWKVCYCMRIMLPRHPPHPPLQVPTLTKPNDWNEESICEITNKANPLVPTERLNKVYPNPSRPEYDQAHIIAWTGKLHLNCWIVGEPTRCIFPVMIDNNKSVVDLQQVFWTPRHSFSSNNDELDIMLWKVRSSAFSVSSLSIGKGFDTRQGQQAR